MTNSAIQNLINYTKLPGFKCLPDNHIVTKGSSLAARQLTAGDLKEVAKFLEENFYIGTE